MVRFFKNKKKASVFFASASLLLIGGAFALSQDISIFSNLFGLGFYRTVNYEEFVSPDNWNTCETVEKILKVRNEASMKIAVRLSYDEFWKAADGETDLPLEKDGITLAEIIYQNEDDWELRDGYYYYTVDLEPNEETSSLFEGVKLSCDANLTEEESVCAQTATGTECTDPDNEYAGAHYHLHIKVETIQADKKDEWEPDDSETIAGVTKIRAEEHDPVAIDFKRRATVAEGNGNGVNILTGTENDAHPVYYYRGELDYNNVIYADYCWKILRTTSTGGTKIIYNGPAVDGKCSDDNSSVYGYKGIKVPDGNYQKVSEWEYDVQDYVQIEGAYPFGVNDYEYSDEDELGHVGYMYSDLTNNYPSFSETEIEYPYGETYTFSKKASYYDGKYHLVNPTSIVATIPPDGNDDNRSAAIDAIITNRLYYWCPGAKATECSQVNYFVGYPRDYYSERWGQYLILSDYLKFTNGMTVEQYMHERLDFNLYDSNAKKVIDTWYESNILGRYDSYLEDTVFCNDRSLAQTNLLSDEFDFYNNKTDGYGNLFKSSVRFNRHWGNQPTFQPTLACDPEDKFTVGSDIGNGKLKYPIALITADEAVLAGAHAQSYYGSYTEVGIFGQSGYGYTMTPVGESGGSDGHSYGLCTFTSRWGLDQNHSSGAYGDTIRPVVSLKPMTKFVEGGDGTLNNPFVVK